MTSDFANVPIEDVKKYWNARPCNIRHSTAEIGTEEYFNQVEQRKYFVEPHIPAFADFDKWNGKTVLEIGCGLGTDTINFARAGADVVAVDVSSESLSLARRRAEVFGLSDKITFVEANAERLSDFVEARPFDLVYSFGVIHHSPHPRKILEHVREHFVHPDTKLKLMVYNRRSWKVFWMAMQELGSWNLDQIIAKHSEAQTGCPITYTYTPATATALLGDLFNVERIFVDHIFPYQIPKYVKYEYEYEWYFRYLPKPVFRALEQKLGWHLCVDARVGR
jgi:2-polyprenyl-3-methyl-5-hydroxy-6-metoxy-1,4-benzoquinol methylase